MTKRSIQRDLIKNNLTSRYDHPTADMVYHSIRQKLPNISLGTVYRNLRFLVEQGDAVSLKLGDGPERFDGHVHPHYHFICSQWTNYPFVRRLPNIVPVKYKVISLTFTVSVKIVNRNINGKMII